MNPRLDGRLDEGSSVPLYHQLRDLIREAIVDGLWKPGDRLPTEDVLCQQYDVSKTTVRQALNSLVIEGRLARKRGKGTFVTEPVIDKGPIQLTSFSEEVRRLGFSPSSRLLKAEEIEASPRIAEALCIEPGDAVFMVERLRLGDGEPMAVQTAYLPASLFPGLLDQDLSTSLYGVLKAVYGVSVESATEVYYPVLLTASQAEELGMPSDKPLGLQAERRSDDENERRVEFACSILRGDRYRISIRLARGGGGPLVGMR